MGAMPTTALQLRPEERKIFEGLSDGLRDGWQVTEEILSAFERAEELEMRYRMASFDHPACQALVDGVKKAKNAAEIEKVVSQFDIAALSQVQMAELFFTLGTRVLSAMVRYALQRAESDEDLEGVAALTEVRHMLFQVNSSS